MAQVTQGGCLSHYDTEEGRFPTLHVGALKYIFFEFYIWGYRPHHRTLISVFSSLAILTVLLLNCLLPG